MFLVDVVDVKKLFYVQENFLFLFLNVSDIVTVFSQACGFGVYLHSH